MDERERQQRIAASRAGRRAAADGEPTAWFDPLYAAAQQADDPESVPWVDLAPNRVLRAWLAETAPAPTRCLVIGSGLGDDAALLAEAGHAVTAFDVAPTAVAWSRRRFPHLPIDWTVARLEDPPAAWVRGFPLVVEVYTVQSLPLAVRRDTCAACARLVAPGGRLVAVARGRDDAETDPKGPPWPLSQAEMGWFAVDGLAVERLDALPDPDDARTLRRLGVFRRP